MQRPSVKKWGPWWIACALLVVIWSTKLPLPNLQPQPIDLSEANAHNRSIPPTITQNVAAIVEGRPLDSYAPLILHFASVLGPEWPIFIFTTHDEVPKSAAFQRALETKRIWIHRLPDSTDFKNRDAVSEFFTTSWFWEQLAPAKHVLLFQSDSIICSNSPVNIENFLEYDFVGAPIDPNRGMGDEGMNGGLSLRNRTTILDIISRHSWKDELAKAKDRNNPKVRYEDQWYYQRLKEMQHRTDGGYEARIPTLEAANRFSVETM